jgi:hypothetical protein
MFFIVDGSCLNKYFNKPSLMMKGIAILLSNTILARRGERRIIVKRDAFPSIFKNYWLSKF